MKTCHALVRHAQREVPLRSGRMDRKKTDPNPGQTHPHISRIAVLTFLSRETREKLARNSAKRGEEMPFASAFCMNKKKPKKAGMMSKNLQVNHDSIRISSQKPLRITRNQPNQASGPTSQALYKFSPTNHHLHPPTTFVSSPLTLVSVKTLVSFARLGRRFSELPGCNLRRPILRRSNDFGQEGTRLPP